MNLAYRLVTALILNKCVTSRVSYVERAFEMYV